MSAEVEGIPSYLQEQKSLLGVSEEEDIVMSTRLPSDVTSVGRGMTNENVYASHTNVCGRRYLQSGPMPSDNGQR